MYRLPKTLARSWRRLSFAKKLAAMVSPVLVAVAAGVAIPIISKLIDPDPPRVLRADLSNVHIETGVTLAEFSASKETAMIHPDRTPAMASGSYTAVRASVPLAQITPGASPAVTPGGQDDADADGVPDALDICPDEPATTDNGCPETTHGDGDGDGVPDAQDVCPDEAATTDDGCPETAHDEGDGESDGDGDGVPDAQDACPDEAATTDNGCPMPRAVPIIVKDYELGCPKSSVGEALLGGSDGCEAVAAVAGVGSASTADKRARATLAALRGSRHERGSGGRLAPLGVVVSFDVALRGFVAKEVDIRWSLHNRSNGTRVPRPWLVNHRVFQLKGEAQNDSASESFWVPLPRGLRGPFFVRITVARRGGDALTYRNTPVFGK